MKMYLISDNLDTLTGMRLAGVDGIVVHERDELKETIEKAMSDPEIGIVLLTEKFGREFPELIDEIKLERKMPLLIEIPDRHGTGRKKDFITSYVNEAIGVKLYAGYRRKVTTLTVEEKISHIREAAMEEARARGNEIIDQHQKALEGVFKTHKQEAVMQADTRIKTETASARQQLNTVTSKGQLKLRRQLSRVQNELKNKLFEEVREMAEEYMKTEAYKELLVSYIAKAARFADGNPLTIYINSSDEDKKEFLEKRTGMTVTVSEEDFLGGIRSIIPGRNILIDHSFSGALEKEYEEFTFKGGVTGE